MAAENSQTEVAFLVPSLRDFILAISKDKIAAILNFVVHDVI